MHRIQRNATAFEPIGDLTQVLLAVGVVQMLARGKNFDGLRSSAYQVVQQAGVKAFLRVNVGGDRSLHMIRIAASARKFCRRENSSPVSLSPSIAWELLLAFGPGFSRTVTTERQQTSEASPLEQRPSNS